MASQVEVLLVSELPGACSSFSGSRAATAGAILLHRAARRAASFRKRVLGWCSVNSICLIARLILC
jgi:hypothetical protein